jgi:hypothetical protein
MASTAILNLHSLQASEEEDLNPVGIPEQSLALYNIPPEHPDYELGLSILRINSDSLLLPAPFIPPQEVLRIVDVVSEVLFLAISNKAQALAGDSPYSRPTSPTGYRNPRI